VVRQGPLDVQAVRRFLEGRGFATDRIVLVGASYGCSVALLSAEKVDGVRAVAALSPGTAYFEVDVVDAASRFTEALLLVAAEDDPPAAASARTLAATHDGPEELIVYASGGHGTRLLSKRPELADRLVTFLQEAVASDASGPSSGPG
jgi:dienelactone hydrolase